MSGDQGKVEVVREELSERPKEAPTMSRADEMQIRSAARRPMAVVDVYGMRSVTDEARYYFAGEKYHGEFLNIHDPEYWTRRGHGPR